MISILRDLFMPDELPSGDKAVYVFLEILAFCFALASVDALVVRHWRSSVAYIAIALFFFIAGTKWPKLKAGFSAAFQPPRIAVNRPIKIPKEVWQQQLRDSRAAMLKQQTDAMNDRIGRADWLQLKKDFDECPREIRGNYFRSGKPPEDGWSIGGMPSPHPDRCRALCQLAGSMLLRSPTVRFRLSEEIRSVADPTYRWLYFLKERKPLDNFRVGYEEIDGQRMGSYSGVINYLPQVSADACIECAAKET
jgi:hypothetical protein